MVKHSIWSSMPNYEDWKDDLRGEYPDLTEDDLVRLMYSINDEYLDDERMNLDVQLDNPIVVIANLGLWYGRRMGYKIIDSGNIKDCLYSDTEDAEWYVDAHKNLRCTAGHHDGTNYYLYREFKPGMSQTQIDNFLYKVYRGTATSRDITRATRRIGDKVCAVYGWA